MKATTIKIPNSPAFAELEQRNDGVYCRLFNKNGPCPAGLVKMKAQSWEQAKADAEKMLLGLQNIMRKAGFA